MRALGLVGASTDPEPLGSGSLSLSHFSHILSQESKMNGGRPGLLSVDLFAFRVLSAFEHEFMTRLAWPDYRIARFDAQVNDSSTKREPILYR